MIQKKEVLLFTVLLLTIVVIGMGSAAIPAGECQIIPGGDYNCFDQNGIVVMRMSDTTNAHGGTEPDSTYTTTLCCNLVDDQACSADAHKVYGAGVPKNKILGLSDVDNAHADVTDGAYSTEICQDGLECVWTIDSTGCASSPYNIETVSLTGNSNAHLGSPADYTYQICCKSIAEPADCGNEELDAGEQCDNSSVDPDAHCIMEPPPADPYYDGTNACTCEDEYIAGPPGKNYCVYDPGLGPANWWSTSEDGPFGLEPDGEVDVHVGYEKFHMNLLAYGLTPFDSIVTFEIYEDDGIFGNDKIRIDVQGINGTVDLNGDVYANWTVSYSDIEKTNDYDDFYFKATHHAVGGPVEIVSQSNFLDFGTLFRPVCEAIDHCMSYRDPIQCGNDSTLCNVSSYSVELNNPNVDCDDPGINCDCWWDIELGECGSLWGATGGVCSYDEDSTDTCEDMFLNYSWTGEISWDEGNSYDVEQDCLDGPLGGPCVLGDDGKWHSDPNDLSGSCVDGVNVVPCPAQIQLPFMTTTNLVILIIVIVIIYIIIESTRKKKGKNKKKK